MAVTMKDIARHCGLSGGAVSQVLRNPENPRFTPETRKLILETAARLDYRQNPLSRALRTSKTNLIGLMLPWNEPEVMDCIERVASENGYKLLIQFSAYPRSGIELEALRSFIDWNVDGIIWEPSGIIADDFLPLLKNIKKSGPPLIMLERGVNGIDFPLVTTDYQPALEECVRHLKENRYQRIVFAFDLARPGILDSKIDGVRTAARKHGMEFEICHLNQSGTSREDEIRSILQAPANRNTCYICYSWLVSDFVDAAEELSMDVPGDLGLVMLIDLLIAGRLRVSKLLRPKITAVRANNAELAELAVTRLLAKIGKAPAEPDTLYHDQAILAIEQSTTRNIQ